jgi:hypothetical protein
MVQESLLRGPAPSSIASQYLCERVGPAQRPRRIGTVGSWPPRHRPAGPVPPVRPALAGSPGPPPAARCHAPRRLRVPRHAARRALEQPPARWPAVASTSRAGPRVRGRYRRGQRVFAPTIPIIRRTQARGSGKGGGRQHCSACASRPSQRWPGPMRAAAVRPPTRD